MIIYGSSATATVRIADTAGATASDASCTFVLYLHPSTNRRQWNGFPTDNGEITQVGGIIMEQLAGRQSDSYTLEHHNHPVSETERDKVVQALHYWNDHNSLLYLTVSDKNAANKAMFLPYNTATPFTLSQWRGKVMSWSEISVDSETDDWTFIVRRATL